MGENQPFVFQITSEDGTTTCSRYYFGCTHPKFEDLSWDATNGTDEKAAIANGLAAAKQIQIGMCKAYSTLLEQQKTTFGNKEKDQIRAINEARIKAGLLYWDNGCYIDTVAKTITFPTKTVDILAIMTKIDPTNKYSSYSGKIVTWSQTGILPSNTTATAVMPTLHDQDGNEFVVKALQGKASSTGQLISAGVYTWSGSWNVKFLVSAPVRKHHSNPPPAPADSNTGGGLIDKTAGL